MPATDTIALVDLLGDTRAAIVHALRGGRRSVAELHGIVDLSEVAVRRQLQVMERDGLVASETVRRDGPGRPGAAWHLTERGRRLLPDASAELADELLTYLEDVHGRRELLAFLRWRSERNQARYAPAVDGDAVGERVAQLAAALSDDGFLSEVDVITAPDGATVLELRQEHCAVRETAEAHPELCAWEAAMFSRVLGAKVSRKSTIAGGAAACVCHIEPGGDAAALPSTEPTADGPRGRDRTADQESH